MNMAQRILGPTVTNFPDLALANGNKHIQMEEIPVNAKSTLAKGSLVLSFDLHLFGDNILNENWGLILTSATRNAS
jgi:hypothetical protein